MTQVPVMEDEGEDQQRDEEEARVIVHGHPDRPSHREKDARPSAPPAGGEDEEEDEGGYERRHEQDAEGEIHNGVHGSAVHGSPNVHGVNKNAGDRQSLQALVR